MCGLRVDSETSKANVVEQPDRSTTRPFSKLELFLPMWNEDADDYFRYFDRTSRFFWPDRKVLVLMDEEKVADHDLARNISSDSNGQVRVAFNPEKPGMSGDDRQQLRMFQADKWTTNEFIGFVDTDAVFTTPVVEESIFDKDRPIIIGKVGKPEGSFWSEVSKSTEWATGSEEVMRCTSFPLVVQRDHLIEMRSWFEERHNVTFEVFFDMLIEHHPYSPYNLMCKWLYSFKHGSYSWRIQRTGLERSSINHAGGQGDENQLQMLLGLERTQPQVRVAQHARYDNISSDDDVAQAMTTGFCNANGQKECNANGQLHDDLFVFEGDSWQRDGIGCLAAQRTHYENVERHNFSFRSPDQQNALKWVSAQLLSSKRRHHRARDPSSGSAATSAKPFQMARTRKYEGGLPKYSVQRRAAITAEGKCNSTKWAVVTTIFDVTTAIKQLDSLPDWCTVVVADKKSVPSLREWFPESHRVRYLTAQEQEHLGFKSIDETPWNHFARKNIGFLYAIREGAEAILDFDDDNEIVMPITSPALLSPSGGETLRARSVSHPGAINVYNYFKPSDHVWPRGLPLDEARQTLSSRRAGKVKVPRSRIAVWQHLAQLDPDVDAIWRQTHELPLKFAKHSDPLVLEKGSWAPFNAQATVWTKASFLMMRLPSTVHGRVSDIWRSYISQPLLWSQNLSVAFAAPQFSVPNRNAHNYLGDFEAEIPLYRQAGALMNHLVQMSDQAATTCSGCDPHELLFKVYVELYENEIVQIEDVNAVKAWIDDMRALGL